MNCLLKLTEHGQSYWIDNLTRQMINSGELTRRVEEEGLCGVTSNPSIFQKAFTSGNAYDAQISEAAQKRLPLHKVYELLTTTDIRNACDVLRPVYDATQGKDGYVSLEVSPHLAHDAESSIEEAQRLWQTVNRPNLMLKVPGTDEGVFVVEKLLSEGININITLLFSVQRYQAVADAHMRALTQREQLGKPIEHIASVASFFLSRIDTLVDKLLSQRIGPASAQRNPNPGHLFGKAAVANAKLAYAQFKQNQQSDGWKMLEQKGAQPQRILWASTSTKNPDYNDIMYVEPLIGPHTINTMTTETSDAFADHGVAKNSVEQDLEQAQTVMKALEQIGIDMFLVTEQLLNEGIQKFIDPYDAMLNAIETKFSRYTSHQHAAPLETMARKLRAEVIRMTTEAGSGHATSSLSCADIMAALFFHAMRWDPADPAARDVDTFVLSKGHAAPILWATLFEAGAIDENPLTLRNINSSLEGHPTPANPWIKIATGSLGQGLAAANGIASANKMDNIDARVFCLLGDGECAEGSVWEAAQYAAVNRLSNLVAIVDVNGLGQSGPTPYGHDTTVYAKRFEAFGWQAIEIDGHDMTAILDVLFHAGKSGPLAIVAKTLKGKGVSFLEDKEGYHGKALEEEKMQQALTELGQNHVYLKIEPRRVSAHIPKFPVSKTHIAVRYELGQKEATRAAFGRALKKLGEINPYIVVLDGDVKNSTHTDEFAQAFPERFFESFIAEQNMAGMALGLAKSGKIPFVATFACFLTRAFDFIRMAAHSRPEHLVFCGSHAGVSIGEDGPSQMGLEDIAMFRALHGSSIFYPCDAVSAERLTEKAAETENIVYIRTTRPKTPVIYNNTDTFEAGGSKVLRCSDHDQYTIVAAGITVHEALAAYDMLQQDGITVRVIDTYSVKPLDIKTLENAASMTQAIVTVEDHWIDGGLGDAVAVQLHTQTPVIRLAITEEPHSGTCKQLLSIHGISREAIYKQIMSLVNNKSVEVSTA
jgi:transketolase